jgi:dephospho-CoA kinase
VVTIGLTGGIASGKSSVARILHQLGAVVIDADQLSRQAVAIGTPVLAKITEQFGPTILAADGTLDRQRMARLVFADAEKRRQLEAIVHPEVRRLAEEQLATLQSSGAAVAFYMAPLLYERGLDTGMDQVWVVYVDARTQINRLMGRDGLSEAEAKQRLAAQMPLEEKRQRGDVVIDNSGSLAETELQVRTAWERLKKREARS